MDGNMMDPQEYLQGDWSAVSDLAAKTAMVLAATAYRAGMRTMQLGYEHAASVGQLAADVASGGDDTDEAMAKLRDEILGAAREVTEAVWQEARRGLDDLDLMTRDDEPGDEGSRPWRVKP